MRYQPASPSIRRGRASLPVEPDRSEKGTGNQGRHSVIRVHAVPVDRDWIVGGEQSIDSGLHVDEHAARCRSGDLLHNGAVPVHRRARRVLPVRLDVVRRHQDEALEQRRCGGETSSRRRIVLAPDVVRANHDRQPVRLQVQHVPLPSRLEIASRVSADAHVDDPDHALGIHRAQQRVAARGRTRSANARMPSTSSSSRWPE